MAVKVYDARLLCQMSGMQTCMLPRELIWKEMAPPHISVTQDSILKGPEPEKLVKHFRW